MKSKYHTGRCHWCLCQVCIRIGCPKNTRKFSKYYNMEFCWYMIERDLCPTVMCDFFQHKEIRHVFRISSRVTKKDQLFEKLTTLEEKLDQLLEKL